MIDVAQAFAAQAAATPDAPAVALPEASLSYAELDRAVSAVARDLDGRGIRPGDVVAIDAPDLLRQLFASLALARLGACQIAFQRKDPPLVRADVERRLRPKALIRSGPTLSQARRLTASHFPPRPVDPAAHFAIKRSSGTTGMPRLAAWTRAGIAHSAGAYPVLAGEAPQRLLSLIHIGLPGALSGVLHCLNTGGCLVLAPVGGDPAALARFVNASGVNVLYGTAVHAHWLLKAAPQGGGMLFPGLGAFAIGSTLIEDRLREAIRARLTPRLWIFYGINEVGFVSAAPPDLVARQPGTVGFPRPGVELRFTDGLVSLRSPEMVSGYLDEPEASATAFRDGWFHTSDRVERLADGSLVHRGRADDLIIYSGVNIDPSEIESVLAAHPKVAEAAAFGVPSESAGQLPAAAVVLRARVGPDELADWCRERLGQRAPHRILVRKALPRNAAGKVLKRELAAILAK